MGTNAPGRMGRHFYAYASLNFQMDESRLCLPNKVTFLLFLVKKIATMWVVYHIVSLRIEA
jgi:hypothetical protein